MLQQQQISMVTVANIYQDTGPRVWYWKRKYFPTQNKFFDMVTIDDDVDNGHDNIANDTNYDPLC